MKVGGGRFKTLLATTIGLGISFSVLGVVDTGLTLTSPVCTNNTFAFVLNGQYGFRYLIETSTNLQSWTTVLTNDGPDYSRPLAISTSRDHAFYRARMGNQATYSAGIVAQTNMTLSGNHITVDSFNSLDTNKFPGGQWNVTNRTDNGNIASIYGTITVDDAQIMGRVLIGSPDGTVILKSSGSVGDLAWVTGSNKGIEPGRYVTNFPMNPPDVFPPYSTGTNPGSGTTNTYVLDSGNYLINGDLVLNSGDSLLVDSWQTATLYVTGNVQMSASASIIIMRGASLQLYVGGPSATITQVNNPWTPNAFIYYGLPGNTNISCSPPSGSFTGLMYAPEASLTIKGGNSSPTQFQGGWLLNSINFSGNVDFHVDEAFAPTVIIMFF